MRSAVHGEDTSDMFALPFAADSEPTTALHSPTVYNSTAIPLGFG